MFFRKTSLKGRHLVDSSMEFQLILKIALLPLQAMKRDEYTSLFTLRTYYRLLCEWKCAFCKNCAEYIHMPLQVRCCVECLRHGWIDLAMTNVEDLKSIACFTDNEFNALIRDGTPWSVNNPQDFFWNSKWIRNGMKWTTYSVREAVLDGKVKILDRKWTRVFSLRGVFVQSWMVPIICLHVAHFRAMI
jgi:hypothetical protein